MDSLNTHPGVRLASTACRAPFTRQRLGRALPVILLASFAGPVGAGVFVQGDTNPDTVTSQTFWQTFFLTIGRDTEGLLVVDQGSNVTSVDAFLGTNVSGNGFALITDPRSSWQVSDELIIGDAGEGGVGFSLGATGTARSVTLAREAGSDGVLTLDSASSLQIENTLVVGESGTGLLQVFDPGTRLESRSGLLGVGPGSEGVATVRGAGTRWDIDFELSIGDEGAGRVSIGNGAIVNVGGPTRLGERGGQGRLNLSGGTLNTDSLRAPLADYAFGTGTINTRGLLTDLDLEFNAVRGLQQTISMGNVLFPFPSGVTLNIDARQTDTKPAIFGAGYAAAGSLKIANGVVLPSVNGILGSQATASGTAEVRGAGSAWELDGSLRVGLSGTGEATVTDGGRVTGLSITLGVFEGSEGTAIVRGPGSRWENSSTLAVGFEGTGSFIVEDGGVAVAEVITTAERTGAVGRLVVRGDGSLLEVNRGLAIALAGTGSLHVADGGLVRSGGNVTVGNFGPVPPSPDGGGTVTLDNGRIETVGLAASPADLHGVGTIATNSLLSDIDLVIDSPDDLQQTLLLDNLPGQQVAIELDATTTSNTTGVWGAGFAGRSSLTVAGGMTIEAGFGSAGFLSGSRGVIEVRGPGSSWITTEQLTIGERGEGILRLGEGASTSASRFTLGVVDGSSGAATLEGDGSMLTTTTRLVVASAGRGDLLLRRGATAVVSDVIVAAEESGEGVLTIDGSETTFHVTGDVTVGGQGDGVLNVFNGGLLRVDGDVRINTSFGLASELRISTGGRLAVFGDFDDSLSQFLLSRSISNGGLLTFWDGGSWESARFDLTPDLYTLQHHDTGDLAGYTVLTIEAPEGMLPGDFNGDGLVDAGDYSIYRDGLGSTYSRPDFAAWSAHYGAGLSGDFNGDGVVNAVDYTAYRDGLGKAYSEDDYAAWSQNYGNGNATGPAVPEPTTSVLLTVALAAAVAGRVRS